MMDDQLELALHYAGEGNDIKSLKNIARSESRRAQRDRDMLSAVLAVTGPVQIDASALARQSGTTLTLQEDRANGRWTVGLQDRQGRTINKNARRN